MRSVKIRILLEAVEDLELARNPEADPEKLQDLYHKVLGHRKAPAYTDSDQEEVTQELTKNPNITPNMWTKLLSHHPKEALENPALDLWKLENPDFIKSHGIQADYLNAILHTGKVERYSSDYFKELMAMDHVGRLKQDIEVIDPSIHPDAHKLLHTLAQHSDSGIRNAVAQNTETHPNTLALLSGDPHPEIRKQVAYHNYTPKDIASNLIKDPEYEVKSAVAYRSDVSNLDNIQDFIDDPIMRRKLANNMNASPELLRKIYNTNDPYHHIELLHNRNLPPDVAIALSKSPITAVQRHLVYHKNVPPEALHNLVGSDSSDVINGIATNNNTHPNTLELLGKHSDPLVRLYVAQHKNTPIDTKIKLTDDPDFKVSRAAEKNL